MRLVLVAIALAALPARADDLLLAPGRSVTLLDAADPAVRVVITAPANAPLNLTPLLSSDPKEGVRAVVTRMQLQQARAIAANPDGSLSLSAGALPGPAQRATVLEGGVIVYDAGKYTVHPARPPAAAARAQPTPAPGTAGARAQITKAGTTKEQAERDLRQCRAYAEGAAARFLTSDHKTMMYNAAMTSCLRSFGYEIRPAPG